MKRKTLIGISIVSLLAGLLVAERLGYSGVLGRSSEARALTSDWPCCAATTDRIAVKTDQTVSLELKNTGEESLAVRLQFVDKEGKVLREKETTIKPGDGGELEYGGFSGGVRTVEFQAQFGTQEATSIGLLRPALRIVENRNGKTVRLIGPEGFKRSKLIPGPH